MSDISQSRLKVAAALNEVSDALSRARADFVAYSLLCEDQGGEVEEKPSGFFMEGHPLLSPGGRLTKEARSVQVAEASSGMWHPVHPDEEDSDRIHVVSDQGFIRAFDRMTLDDRGSRFINNGPWDLEGYAVKMVRDGEGWKTGDKLLLAEREERIITMSGKESVILHPNIPVEGGLGSEGIDYDRLGVLRIVSQASKSVWDMSGEEERMHRYHQSQTIVGLDDIRIYGDHWLLTDCRGKFGHVVHPGGGHRFDLPESDIECVFLLPENDDTGKWEVGLCIDKGQASPGYLKVWEAE